MKYKINWDEGVFAVPDCAAEGLKLASGKAVKVLLYIAKFKTDDGICEYLGITEEDLEDAAAFWRNTGVFLDSETAAVTGKSSSAAEPPKKETAAAPKPAKLMSAGEVAERLGSSSELRMLFDAIQVSLGRQLSFNDQTSLIWIYDHLGLNSEVMLMLVNYCAGIGKANMRYIEKLAVSWADEGIDSSTAADAKILALQKSSSLYEQCARRMNLNRGLSEKEKEYTSKWTEAGADIDLILNAYERTVESTGKVSFPYMNRILTNWLENGIRTPAEADEFSDRTAPKRRPAYAAQAAPKGSNSFNTALSDIIELSKTTPIIP